MLRSPLAPSAAAAAALLLHLLLSQTALAWLSTAHVQAQAPPEAADPRVLPHTPLPSEIPVAPVPLPPAAYKPAPRPGRFTRRGRRNGRAPNQVPPTAAPLQPMQAPDPAPPPTELPQLLPPLPAAPDMPPLLPPLPEAPMPAPLPADSPPPPGAAEPPRPPGGLLLPGQKPLDLPPLPAGLPAGLPPAPPAMPPDMPGEPQPEDGDLRLVDRLDVNGFATGALQLFRDGAWGLVCSDLFDDRDAAVACRQLGLLGGTTLLRSVAEAGLAPYVATRIGCTGNEAALRDCPVQADAFGGGCEPQSGRDTFITCGTSSEAEEGAVRLAGGGVAAGGAAKYGRLEVFVGGGWAAACESAPRSAGVERELLDPDSRFNGSVRFNEAAASVVCQQLGFPAGFSPQPTILADAEGLDRVPSLVAGGACDGEEASLLDCPGVLVGAAADLQCTMRVNVLCHAGPSPERDGQLRLMGGEAGPGFEYGRLEIFLRGFWSNICDAGGFSAAAAQVACRALGFSSGSSLSFPQPFIGKENRVLLAELPVALAAVNCMGDEESLLDCSSDDAMIRRCGVPDTTFTDSTVLACADVAGGECDRAPRQEQGAVRLVRGEGTPCDVLHSGVIEIFNEGDWGTVCETNALGADVVCRQLGFPHGTLVTDDPRASNPNARDRWLVETTCRGPETALVDCDLGPAGFHGGRQPCGQRESGQRVACRQFAVEAALEAVTSPSAEEGDLRLLDPAPNGNWVMGTLEVFFEGSWSQVCGESFGGADAAVACRQLGFAAAGTVGPLLLNNDPFVGLGTLLFPEVALSLSGCNGSEARLLDCAADRRSEPFSSFELGRGCRSNESPGLKVACVTAPLRGEEEGALRLVDRLETANGVVGTPEVFHAGAWGTFCNANDASADVLSLLERPDLFDPRRFRQASATVACQELGFQGGFARPTDSMPPPGPPGGPPLPGAPRTLPPPPESPPQPSWLAGLTCSGEEERIAACRQPPFGDVGACGAIYKLFCFTSNAKDSEARLAGGSVDTGGAWAYGRLEVQDRGFFSGLVENPARSQGLGRRGAAAACRSLGFTAGGQLIAGAEASALPGRANLTTSISRVFCGTGEEQSLAECGVVRDAGPFADYETLVDGAVAVLCAAPSGCDEEEAPPQQGDVRLTALRGGGAATAACDAAHMGGVEIFNAGRWGRICAGGGPSQFVVTAQVACRQLGFPFGSLLDPEETLSDANSYSYYDADPFDYDAVTKRNLVWATQVACSGAEARLDECVFPQAAAGGGDGSLGLPANGFPGQDCAVSDAGILAVACRRFQIAESALVP
eukprot:jgi/Ulvmu1/9614/UM054_0044.1